MRWSIIRLIWLRELRDQLRDRRTVFMIAVLPVVLYPLGGFAFMQVASMFLTQPARVGLVGAENLHPWRSAGPTASPPLPPGRGLVFPSADTSPPGGKRAHFRARGSRGAAAGSPAGIDRRELDNRAVDAILAVP